jgi:glycine C-acetyltransferase
MIVAGSIACLDLLESSTDLKATLEANTKYYRKRISEIGYTVKEGTHPIVPIMIGDAVKASKLAENMLKSGVYVIAFSYPVVPKGEARIRTQVSALHTKEDLDMTIEAFQRNL